MFHGPGKPRYIISAHEELVKQGAGFATGNGDKLGGLVVETKSNIAVFRE